MSDDRNNLLKQKELAWQERITIGKGPSYILEDKSDIIEKDKKRKIAGWVHLNDGKYEAGIPGEPSEALYNKNLLEENFAIKLGCFADIDTAKQAVEKYIPDKSEWIYL